MRKIFLFLCTMLMALVPQMVLAQQSTVTLSFVVDGSTVRQMTATLGEDFIEPTLTASDPVALRSVTYSSINPTVATIDATSGQVTLVAAGNTTIVATFPGNESYYATRASYTLIVEQATTPDPEPTCPQAHYNLSSADNVLHMTVGDVVSIPELLGGAGAILPLSAKTVEGIRVAELTENDMIHAVGAGTAQFIGLYMYASTAGQTMQCEYSFDIIVTAPQPTKLDPELSFDETEVYAELGMPFTPPTFHNPHNVPINKWNSQNIDVAEVSEDGSVVTIKAVGDALIFCESFETDTYYAKSVSYTIHVTTSGLTVAGVTVNSGNAANIFGNGTAWYDEPTRTLYLSGFSYTGQNILNEMPARRVKEAGSANAAIVYEKHDRPLTIVVDSIVEIRNAATCIYAQAPVVMMGSERGGYMTMEATSVAVSTVAFKIHQCWVSASGAAAALAIGQELGVSRGGYLLANSNGIAIQCASFVKAEDNNGEGIEILTEGVFFKQNAGFYVAATKQPAKTVEIGKVPVVVPDDEVTTIDFSATDPEGNESVVFSADANNAFNEETGQLEITTALSDETVASALENLVPGSSAWLNLLPGSIVFDIPAGQGTIRVQCITLAGYVLQVKVDGVAAVSIAQTELGWAAVTYNVAVPTHVVIYLHAIAVPSAPARIATSAKDEDPSVGAYVQALEIVPQNAPTAIDNANDQSPMTNKVLRDSQLFIQRDGKTYTITGQEIR